MQDWTKDEVYIHCRPNKASANLVKSPEVSVFPTHCIRPLDPHLAHSPDAGCTAKGMTLGEAALCNGVLVLSS